MYDMPSLPSFYKMSCISCENNSLLTDIYYILLLESKYTNTYVLFCFNSLDLRTIG